MAKLSSQLTVLICIVFQFACESSEHIKVVLEHKFYRGLVENSLRLFLKPTVDFSKRKIKNILIEAKNNFTGLSYVNEIYRK